VREEEGRIIIEPVRQKAYDLHALLKGITPKNQHQAADFGPELGESCGNASVCARSRGHRVAELYAAGWARAGGPSPGAGAESASYNDKTSLWICRPLATQIKNYAFEVLIAGTPQNVIPADQVKSLAWRARKAVRKGAVSFEEPVQAAGLAVEMALV
jgi:hypothetical protein